jgi:hypothetical protein
MGLFRQAVSAGIDAKKCVVKTGTPSVSRLVVAAMLQRLSITLHNFKNFKFD